MNVNEPCLTFPLLLYSQQAATALATVAADQAAHEASVQAYYKKKAQEAALQLLTRVATWNNKTDQALILNIQQQVFTQDRLYKNLLDNFVYLQTSLYECWKEIFNIVVDKMEVPLPSLIDGNNRDAYFSTHDFLNEPWVCGFGKNQLCVQGSGAYPVMDDDTYVKWFEVAYGNMIEGSVDVESWINTSLPHHYNGPPNAALEAAVGSVRKVSEKLFEALEAFQKIMNDKTAHLIPQPGDSVYTVEYQYTH